VRSAHGRESRPILQTRPPAIPDNVWLNRSLDTQCLCIMDALPRTSPTNYPEARNLTVSKRCGHQPKERTSYLKGFQCLTKRAKLVHQCRMRMNQFYRAISGRNTMINGGPFHKNVVPRTNAFVLGLSKLLPQLAACEAGFNVMPRTVYVDARSLFFRSADGGKSRGTPKFLGIYPQRFLSIDRRNRAPIPNLAQRRRDVGQFYVDVQDPSVRGLRGQFPVIPRTTE